jgi:dipeptide/tripeptide permease
MTKRNKILLSIGTIICGCLLNAFAWTTKLGHPISTICLLLGLGLFFSGLIFLIVTLSKRKQNDNKHSTKD